MAQLDLGTLRGHVELDASKFDRKYAEVIGFLEKLERRPDPEISVDADTAQADQRIGEVQDQLQGLDASRRLDGSARPLPRRPVTRWCCPPGPGIRALTPSFWRERCRFSPKLMKP